MMQLEALTMDIALFFLYRNGNLPQVLLRIIILPQANRLESLGRDKIEFLSLEPENRGLLSARET